MRKTSQDGGDSTSITSGIENEIKKPGAIIKTKRSSIKRKVQNFSHESDDAVVEPLLQKDKEKNDISNQSAKYNLMSKTKTDTTSERGGDKDKLLPDDELEKSALCKASDDTDGVLSTYSMKENSMSKTGATAPMHNHMNTNVFNGHDALKGFVAPKSQILIEIDGCKQVGYNPSPLIFTTAKIHTDGKTKHMEPLQVTPVPILSTIEVSVLNTGKNKVETSGLVNSSFTTIYTNMPKSNIKTMEKEQNPPVKTVSNTPTPPNKLVDTKISSSTDKTTISSISPPNNSKSFLASKDTKISHSTNSPDDIKDNVVENKRTTIENKKDQDGYETKMPTSQPTILTTSVKTKTITPSETVKSIHITPTTTNFTSITKNTKDSRVIDQAVATSKDKTDVLKYLEKKNDLNKNDKPESLDSQRATASDNVYLQSNEMNTSDKTSKDQTVINTNTSFNGRQLQRQNIITDDHNLKLKPRIGLYSSTDDSKSLTKSGEHSHPSIIEGNSLNKVKLPKPTVSVSNSAIVDKTSAPISTVAGLTKMSTPIITTASVNKTSASTTTAKTVNITSASITAAVALNKMSDPIITTASVNKTSASIIMAASINKLPAPINTTAAVNKSYAPITTTGAVNKTSASITTAAPLNKTSAPISTTAAISETSAPITTTTVINRKTAPITSTTVINKTTASTTTNAAINKPSAPISTSATINKTPAPIITTVSDSKSSALMSTIAAANKTSIPITNIESINKSSAPIITAAAINKISAPTTIAAAVNKTSAPVITTAAANKTSTVNTAAAANKSLIANTISSIKLSITSSNTLPTTSNTPNVKSAIATTSSASEPLTTEKYSNSNVTISRNTIQIKTTSASTTTKSQVTINTKPSSTSTKLTKASKVVTSNTISQPSTVVNSPTVTTAKSAITKKMPTVENQGKLTETTNTSSTSDAKPSTGKSNSTFIGSSASATHGISNVAPTATPTSSNSASSGHSSKLAVSNKQSESKSNELSNGNKSLNA